MAPYPYAPQVVQACFLGTRLQLPVRHVPAGAVQLATRGPATQLPPALPSLRAGGAGRRLPEVVQQRMEVLFGASFSDVRVHVGNEASSIGAVAFTHGSDLYFAHGQYNPLSPHGQRLIGHELAHVLQQRAGRVRNPFGSGIALVQDQGLEAEAERMGLRAAAAGPVQAKTIPPPRPVAASRPGTVQRMMTVHEEKQRRGWISVSIPFTIVKIEESDRVDVLETLRSWKQVAEARYDKVIEILKSLQKDVQTNAESYYSAEVRELRTQWKSTRKKAVHLYSARDLLGQLIKTFQSRAPEGAYLAKIGSAIEALMTTQVKSGQLFIDDLVSNPVRIAPESGETPMSGAASALMAYAARLAKDLSIDKPRVFLHAATARAKDFYWDMGFEVVRTETIPTSQSTYLRAIEEAKDATDVLKRPKIEKSGAKVPRPPSSYASLLTKPEWHQRNFLRLEGESLDNLLPKETK